MLVRDIMTRDFKIVPPETTLQEAACLMRDEDFGFLPKPFTLKQLVEAVKTHLG